jgi:hypothetical protein
MFSDAVGSAKKVVSTGLAALAFTSGLRFASDEVGENWLSG